ncbi:hypothetical protein P3G55_08005 [Leptospira sp. 96542]|nr:hypothetical protein [Leptospira sp. 96542]
MKTTKMIATGILALGLATANLQALDTNERLELLEAAMIEQATTPAQKSAVSEYLANISKEKMELAQALRERAGATRGGKIVSQNNEKKALLQRAAALEAEAKKYQRVSMGLQTEASQVAQN